VSLNSFGLFSALASMTQSMILDASSAFWEMMSPYVPSPPCGQERLYSTPMAPAFSKLPGVRLPDSPVLLILAGDRPAGRSERQPIGELLIKRPTSWHTRSRGWPETLSQLP